MKKKWLLTLTALVLCGGVSTLRADSSQDESLESKVQRLEKLVGDQADQIRSLEDQRGESWLNERRAEEVKTLVREVLADADTRASLLSSSITAGHNGENFFVGTEDGSYLLRLSGLIQARYVANFITNAEEDDNDNEIQNGFQNRRSRVRLDGNVVQPNIRYGLQFDFTFEENNNDGNINGPGTEDSTSGFGFLEEAWMAYDYENGMSIQVGQFKGPFAREELVDEGKQLAIERSYTTDYFTLDYVQGVQGSWTTELGSLPTWMAVMIHDGSYSSAINFNQELVDIAIAARIQSLLIGDDWAATRDFTTFSDQQEILLVGAAIDWQLGENGDGATDEDDSAHIKFTVDASYENPALSNFNAFVAYYGQYIYDTGDLFVSSLGEDSFYQQAVVVQAGVHVIPDKVELFARYEYFDTDGVVYYQSPEDGAERNLFALSSNDEDTYHIITGGVNYFVSRNRVKLSLDVMYVLEGITESNTGAGIDDPFINSNDAKQLVVRAQAQLAF